jgi:hypothetical protein
MEPTVASEPERLTWAEIRRRYPDQHVVLVETDWGDGTSFEFRHAVVFGCAPTEKEASPIVKQAFLKYRRVGTRWTGPPRRPDPRFEIK